MKRTQNHSSFSRKGNVSTGLSVQKIIHLFPAKALYMRLMVLLFVLTMAGRVSAQEDSSMARSLEVYGFIMLDMGYDVKQINPNWYDAMRITKLPSYKDQFAPDGRTFFGVRQTRFGVRGY